MIVSVQCDWLTFGGPLSGRLSLSRIEIFRPTSRWGQQAPLHPYSSHSSSQEPRLPQGCYEIQWWVTPNLTRNVRVYFWFSLFLSLFFLDRPLGVSTPDSVKRKKFGVIHQATSSHSLWYDIKTLRWVVEPGTLFASYRTLFQKSHIVYSFFYQAPPHPVHSIRKLGTPSTLRSPRDRKSVV